MAAHFRPSTAIKRSRLLKGELEALVVGEKKLGMSLEDVLEARERGRIGEHESPDFVEVQGRRFGTVPIRDGQVYWYATKNAAEGERDSKSR